MGKKKKEETLVKTDITVSVQRITNAGMYLRTAIGSGEAIGRKFNLSTGMDGSLFVEFDKKESEDQSGSKLAHDRYLVKMEDVARAICDHINERDGGS